MAKFYIETIEDFEDVRQVIEWRYQQLLTELNTLSIYDPDPNCDCGRGRVSHIADWLSLLSALHQLLIGRDAEEFLYLLELHGELLYSALMGVILGANPDPEMRNRLRDRFEEFLLQFDQVYQEGEEHQVVSNWIDQCLHLDVLDDEL